MVNKPSQISPHDVLQLWLINTVYHLLVKNKSGEGRGVGALNRGFTVCKEHLFQAFCVTTYSWWSESTSIFLHKRRHAPCIVMSSIIPSLSILNIWRHGGVNSSSVGHLLWSPLWRRNFSMWSAVAQFHHCQCSVQKYSKVILHCNLIKWSLTYSCSAF